MAAPMRSPRHTKLDEPLRLILTAIVSVVVGFFVGASLPNTSLIKVDILNIRQKAARLNYLDRVNALLHKQSLLNLRRPSSSEISKTTKETRLTGNSTIYVHTNPRGTEMLPPGIINATSDLYLRRLWGDPNEDLVLKPKYLLVLTVGYRQKYIIDAVIRKFSENFSVVLFHYDGKTSEWDEFEWSQRAIHVSARKQTKWWFAKRFLHPDIVAPYDYIFIWDVDLGVEHFNAEEYLNLVRKHDLEISQPALEENNVLTWLLTRRRTDVEIHKETEERPGWCQDPHQPPCAGFVEIMAPVFSRNAWRCAWHMIQNDLVHGWGLDLALQKCVELPHEKIGVVDAQWIVHMVFPSLGDQGEAIDGRQPWEGVRARCREEWTEFKARVVKAEKDFHSRTSNEDDTLMN